MHGPISLDDEEHPCFKCGEQNALVAGGINLGNNAYPVNIKPGKHQLIYLLSILKAYLFFSW